MTDEESIKPAATRLTRRLYKKRAAKNAEILRNFFANKPNGKLEIYNCSIYNCSKNNYPQPLITEYELKEKSTNEIVLIIHDDRVTDFIPGDGSLNSTDPELLLEQECRRICFSHGVRTCLELVSSSDTQ